MWGSLDLRPAGRCPLRTSAIALFLAVAVACGGGAGSPMDALSDAATRDVPATDVLGAGPEAAATDDGAQPDFVADSSPQDAPALGDDAVDAVHLGPETAPLDDTAADLPFDTTPDLPPPTGPVHFAVVSDTHMTGDPEDAANRNFTRAAGLLAASEGRTERLYVTGDITADLLTVQDYAQAWLDGEGDSIPVLDEMRRLADTLLSGAIRLVLGNHDNRFIDQFQGNEVPLAAWLRAFEGSPSFPAPWYVEDIRGCRFVVLWSCEMAISHASNDTPTFGDGQIAWLREQLADGLPTVVFWHHWIGPWTNPEPPPPLLAALADNPTSADRVTFSGHSHDWRRHEWQGTRFYQTAALRDEPDAIHRAVCDGATGTIVVTNEDGIPYLP